MSVLVAAVLFGLRVVVLGALCCSNKAHRREDSLDACGIIIARGLAANLLLILLLWLPFCLSFFDWLLLLLFL